MGAGLSQGRRFKIAFIFPEFSGFSYWQTCVTWIEPALSLVEASDPSADSVGWLKIREYKQSGYF